MKSDDDIIEGFLRDDIDAFRQLLQRFRPACLDKIEMDHYGLWHEREEIVDAAETRLLEWRSRHLDGELRFPPGERIQRLAWRITKQECDAAEGYARRQEAARLIQEQEQESVENAEDRVAYGELVEEIESLPEELSEVLMAEADRILNNGPQLEERFGITPSAARKRLQRAREEFSQMLGRKDDDNDEN